MKKTKKFDAHAEAMKIIKAEDKRNNKLIQIKAETNKITGTRVCVNMSDGTRKVFFYAEGGMWKGWNDE